MDLSLEEWISDLEMEDYFVDDQYQTNSVMTGFNPVEDWTELVLTTPKPSLFVPQSSSSSESDSISSPTNASTTTAAFGGGGPSSVQKFETAGFDERPTKQIKNTPSTTNRNNTATRGRINATDQVISPNNTSSTSFHLPFADSDSPPTNPPSLLDENMEELPKDNELVISNADHVSLLVNNDGHLKAGQKRPNAVARTPLEAQDRVMAERKRREKLSQRFIALSAIVPGLKKMDKASVLGDAIKYLKQLQENVKLLEEKINKNSEESVVFVKKSQLHSDDDTSSCDENFDGRFKEALPEIEARISERNILIRIHCEKQKGFAVKLLSEIEKLHLSIVNSSFLPFGKYAMDITVVAQMDDEFCMTVKDLVRNLRSAFLKFL